MRLTSPRRCVDEHAEAVGDAGGGVAVAGRAPGGERVAVAVGSSCAAGAAAPTASARPRCGGGPRSTRRSPGRRAGAASPAGRRAGAAPGAWAADGWRISAPHRAVATRRRAGAGASSPTTTQHVATTVSTRSGRVPGCAAGRHASRWRAPGTRPRPRRGRLDRRRRGRRGPARRTARCHGSAAHVDVRRSGDGSGTSARTTSSTWSVTVPRALVSCRRGGSRSAIGDQHSWPGGERPTGRHRSIESGVVEQRRRRRAATARRRAGTARRAARRPTARPGRRRRRGTRRSGRAGTSRLAGAADAAGRAVAAASSASAASRSAA